MKTLILFLILATSLSLFSADQCVSGQSNATNLIDQMNGAKNKSAITKLIYSQYALGSEKTEGKASYECAECTAKEQVKLTKDLKQIPNAMTENKSAPHLLFKKECLIESGHFKAGTPEVICPEGSKAKNRNLCLTENLLQYQNAVISNFSSCMEKSGFRTLDAASLFKLYSLESAFKPQYAYGGGVGSGQLTPIFVEDIHQQHRGLKFLKTVAKSNVNECDAAKIIAKEDIKTKPKIENTCSFTSIGNGLERNILYTLVGLANAWEKDISPKFKAYSEKYKNHPKLHEAENLALLNGYGPGGRVAARAAISRLSELSPDKFIEAIKKPMNKERNKNGSRGLSFYVNNIEQRQKEISRNLKEPLKSSFNQQGASACIN